MYRQERHQTSVICRYHQKPPQFVAEKLILTREEREEGLERIIKPDEGGEETGVPGENPWQRASENATYHSPKIQAPSETRTRAVALVAG